MNGWGVQARGRGARAREQGAWGHRHDPRVRKHGAREHER